MKKKGYVFINGKIVTEDKATVSVFDRGLNYGDGLFETIRTDDGVPLFVREHIERLKAGALSLGIAKQPLAGLEKEIRHGLIEKLVKANGLTRGGARVKIVVTRGVDTLGHLPKKRSKPTVIATADALDDGLITKMQKRGVKATLVNSPLPAIANVKSLNFLPNVLGKAEAERAGVFEALFVDTDSALSEGTSTNLFLVFKGVVKTPRVDRNGAGVLPGVTRGALLALLKKRRIAAREVRLWAKDLRSCDEAFLTNSIIGIVPLIGLGRRGLGKGKGKGCPGPVTRLVQSSFIEEFRPGSKLDF